MINTVLSLMAISLFPILTSVVLRYIEDRFNLIEKIDNRIRQLVYGLIFGGLSVLGTVLGVWTSNHTALINLRDAAPIISGLVFGGPSGIIAGVIGGVYRYVSVYWGGSGALTQVACSVSTVMAGIFTALVRKFIFNNHHGRWYYGLTLGILCESFHMLMVFFTHMSNLTVAYTTVKECYIPMLVANSLAVTVALIGVAFVSKERLWEKHTTRKLSTRLQFSLAFGLIFAFIAVTLFSSFSIDQVANRKTETLLNTNVNDVISQVDDTVYNTIHSQLVEIKKELPPIPTCPTYICSTIQGSFGVAEVSYIEDGKIVQSTEPSFLGFNLRQEGTQAYAFEEWYLNTKEAFYIQEYQPITLNPSIKMKYTAIRCYKGYLQIGYSDVSYHEILDSQIVTSSSYRHVGSSGFVVVATDKGTVLSENTINNGDFSNCPLDTVFTYTDENKVEYYAMAKYVDGYYVVAVTDKTEADIDSEISLLSTTLTELFVFMLLYYIVYAFINQFFVTRMNNVTSGLKNITEGDLDTVINERGCSEFEQLSDGINDTVGSLKGYIEKEANKNKEELAIANAIQHSILPSSFPAFPNIDSFDLYASMDAAKAVGGDFYDFFLIDNRHLAILIADVSGKGIPAAMFMMQAKTLLKNLALEELSVDEILSEANKGLCEGNEAQMFVTCWLGIIDIKTGHVEFANAGHNPPLVKHNGKYEYLDCKPGFILGGMDGIPYRRQEFDLASGDAIFLYTDGVTEATSINTELYGEEKLLQFANTLDYVSAAGFCESVRGSLAKFTEGAEQSDDITMLNFVYLNNIKEKTINVKALTENVDLVTERADKFLKDNLVDKTVINQINVVIDEIFSNICKFAYEGYEEVGKVDFKIEINGNKIKMFFVDNGVKYNPLEQDDPDVTLGFEEREIGGLGIFMIKKMMSHIDYQYKNECNILILEKEFE